MTPSRARGWLVLVLGGGLVVYGLAANQAATITLGFSALGCRAVGAGCGGGAAAVTDRAFWLVVGAYMLLAMGAGVTLALIDRNTDRLEDEQQRLERFAVDVTASICLQAFASEPGEQVLVKAFVDGTPIPLDNQTCQEAVRLARRQLGE